MDTRYALPHRRRPKVAISLVEARVALCIVSILASLSLAAIQMARRSADQAERLNWRRQRILDDPPPRRIPFRILFVGNSHTSNGGIDIPGMVQELSRLAPRGIAARARDDGGNDCGGRGSRGLPTGRGLGNEPEVAIENPALVHDGEGGLTHG